MNPRLNGVHKRQVAFDDSIPMPGPDIFIKRLEADELLTCCILGDEIKGIWVHWAGKKSAPHYEPAAECPGCIAQQAKRWKGFLHVGDSHASKELFLELTPTSARALIEAVGGSENLRATRVNVKRTKGKNGRINITVLGPAKDHDNLPPARDPRNSILKLWGVSPEDPDGWLVEDEPGEDGPAFR